MKLLDGHIEITPGTCGGKPRIAGHRIKVQHVAEWCLNQDFTPEQVARDYQLNVADVYAALTYYYDHQEQIEADVREDEEFIEQYLRENPDRVIDHRRHPPKEILDAFTSLDESEQTRLLADFAHHLTVLARLWYDVDDYTQLTDPTMLRIITELQHGVTSEIRARLHHAARRRSDEDLLNLMLTCDDDLDGRIQKWLEIATGLRKPEVLLSRNEHDRC